MPKVTDIDYNTVAPYYGVCDIIHVFQCEEPLNNSVVLVSTDDYNEKKEKISDLEGKFDLHSKDTMWQGAMEVLSEKPDELIGGER